MKGILEIELKSDLCVGSGYAYAGMIDSDICYNENGFPYIPGRRVKGCLREAAEMIGIPDKRLKEIFGEGGQGDFTNLVIENGYLKEAEVIDQAVTVLKNRHSRENSENVYGKYVKYLTQQKVLEQYSRIKAQTEIGEEGVAEDNSLRYMRVVNQYSPLDQKPMCFQAKLEIHDGKEEMEQIVQAMRHIGMNRTRGLGNVKCRVIWERSETESGSFSKDEISLDSINVDEESMVRLNYVIQNVMPLMMSESYDQQTERYISGKSILGALAGMYLKKEGNSADDALFQDMFLKGEVIFSDLTPTLPEEQKDQERKIYRSYDPAPLFVNRLKKSKKLVNVVKIDDQEAKELEERDRFYDPKKGNQPKKLSTKFVSFVDGDINRVHVMEPEIEIVYHHSKKQKSQNGEEGILYTLEVLQEGQYFSGSIIAKKKYITVAEELLQSQRLRLGKSKSAQYGACRVVELKEEPYQVAVELKEGDKILVSFASNAIFLQDKGNGDARYTVRYEEIEELLAKSLGIVYKKEEQKNTHLQTTVVTGYHTMWNLKKPSIPAVKAGSAIEYVVEKDCKIQKEYVGEKNLEGFGKIRIYLEDKMRYNLEEYKAENDETRDGTEELKICEAILEKVLLDSIMDSMRKKAFEMQPLGISASTLGRVTLMLKESLAENSDTKKAVEGFVKRINSMKRNTERNKIVEFLNYHLLTKNELDTAKMIENKTGEKEAYEDLRQLEKLLLSSEAEADEKTDKIVQKMWGEYLMNILVYQKYRLKI